MNPDRMKYHVSVLDTDLYKLTQAKAIGQLYPRVKAQYTFINRDNREFPNGFAKKLREIVDSYRFLELSKDAKHFLKEKCYYLDPLYIDFLAGYRYDPSEVTIKQFGPNLRVSVRGDWYRTVYWEIPLMETISELYFEMTQKEPANYKLDRIRRLKINGKKAQDLAQAGIYYSDFGARRRYSYGNQDDVVKDLQEYGQGHLLGTSNVYLAMIHDLTPMGTCAHEFSQYHGARYGYKMANEMALEAWSTVYQGDLGIGLTDTYTTDVFLRSFNTKYAKLFDGVRQDSGCPITFVDKIVEHYKKLRINPLFKVAMFSDNLKSINQIKSIHKACQGRIIDRYGIGTWFSNDVPGVKPLNIVIKLTAVDYGQGWVPTVKLSDVLTKNTGDPKEVKLCKKILGIKESICV